MTFTPAELADLAVLRKRENHVRIHPLDRALPALGEPLREDGVLYDLMAIELDDEGVWLWYHEGTRCTNS